LRDETVRARLSELGIEPPDDSRMTPDGARAHMKAEIRKWLPIVKSLGVTLD
jgi:tripartite-type tricarboxylate transporter receptor subunit TctC